MKNVSCWRGGSLVWMGLDAREWWLVIIYVAAWSTPILCAVVGFDRATMFALVALLVHGAWRIR